MKLNYRGIRSTSDKRQLDLVIIQLDIAKPLVYLAILVLVTVHYQRLLYQSPKSGQILLASSSTTEVVYANSLDSRVLISYLTIPILLFVYYFVTFRLRTGGATFDLGQLDYFEGNFPIKGQYKGRGQKYG
jgi:hypothetical protein